MTEGTAQDNFYAMEYSEFYNNIKNLTSELKKHEKSLHRKT